MADIEENAIYAACTMLKECEDMFAPKKSKANEHSDQIISTDNQIDISLQNQDDAINPAEKISAIAEKGPEEAQSALMAVPEPNPSPAEKISGIAEKGPEAVQLALMQVPEPNTSPALASTEDIAGTEQIGAATTPEPAPTEPKRPPKRKRSHRGRRRSTRTIAINPSPEPGIKDNRTRRPGRPNVTDDDDWLPPDWVVRTETRQNGATAGRKDKYYISPEGRQFRSRIAAENYINRSTTEGLDNNYHLRTHKA